MADNNTTKGRIINRGGEIATLPGNGGYAVREIVGGVYEFRKDGSCRCAVDGERADNAGGKGGDCDSARRYGVCKHAYALHMLKARWAYDDAQARNEARALAAADAFAARKRAQNAPALRRAA